MVRQGYDEEFEIYGEENEEDLLIENLDVFNQAVIWGTDWTTETIVSQLRKGNIDLNPKFQRRDAWDDHDKSRLIESLILGLPVPPIILAERKDEKNKYIVIDGKQRLLSLRQFSSKQDEHLFNTLILKDMQFLKSLNGKTFSDIESSIEYSQFRTQYENQTIRTVVIKNWPNEKFLYSVFLRLNTGSKKLSPQELRQALHPGMFLDFLDEATGNSNMFRKILRNENADPRMRDIELALRFYAIKYNITNYRGNLKEFLDDTCKLLNSRWINKKLEIEMGFGNLEKAIQFTMEIFGEKDAFSRWKTNKYSSRFNRALYEVFTYYFAFSEIRDLVIQRKDLFLQKFECLNDTDSQFIDSISSTTKDIGKTVYRFDCIYRIIKELFDDVTIPRFQLHDGRIEIVE
ncbi:DUF262 domain-containing protein [Ruminiclostridium cellobioparum]|uniref:GmrSD restriction endonucleases N-terminal domain-containing protein n=1 Tax=Ruminiclostridium cellobioparum subsp. termitidis CT1112 TaxID=1195236 RepID=S0FJR3_RUMCE|nr:DUF262 domain-containing protein [Ruminiclostridium cellobioparum]EMS70546.1 Protein of unknown function DUF262 [Ruminiclostridium cellobioparum subsp. termitidis CT1112]